jgi:hypothetical protein
LNGPGAQVDSSRALARYYTLDQLEISYDQRGEVESLVGNLEKELQALQRKLPANWPTGFVMTEDLDSRRELQRKCFHTARMRVVGANMQRGLPNAQAATDHAGVPAPQAVPQNQDDTLNSEQGVKKPTNEQRYHCKLLISLDGYYRARLDQVL